MNSSDISETFRIEPNMFAAREEMKGKEDWEKGSKMFVVRER